MSIFTDDSAFGRQRNYFSPRGVRAKALWRVPHAMHHLFQKYQN